MQRDRLNQLFGAKSPTSFSHYETKQVTSKRTRKGSAVKRTRIIHDASGEVKDCFSMTKQKDFQRDVLIEAASLVGSYAMTWLVNRMAGGQPQELTVSPYIDRDGVAKLLCCSLQKVDWLRTKREQTGFPEERRIGTSPLFIRKEVEQWVESRKAT